MVTLSRFSCLKRLIQVFSFTSTSRYHSRTSSGYEFRGIKRDLIRLLDHDSFYGFKIAFQLSKDNNALAFFARVVGERRHLPIS